MSQPPTTIRLTPVLQSFIAARLVGDGDRGSRGPAATRTGILTTLAERYGYLLSTAGESFPMPAAALSLYAHSLSLPLPTTSFPGLSEIVERFDPVVGRILRELGPLERVAFIESLEQAVRAQDKL